MAIKAKISVDNSELKQGLQQAENTARSTMKNIKGITENAGGAFTKIGSAASSAANAIKGGFGGVVSTLAKVGPVGSVAAGAIALIGTAVFGVFNAIGKLSNKLNDIGKAAKSVNMSTDAYQALQFACARTGVSMENVLTMIGKIDQAMTKAIDGEKKYRDIFYSLGLSWRELERLSPEKQLIKIAEANAKLQASGRGTPKELYELLGRRGVQDLNKISADQDFAKYIAVAKSHGVVIDKDMIEAMEAYNDSVGEANKRFETMISNLKDVKNLSKQLKAVWDSLGERAGNTGYVSKEFQDQFIGPFNVVEKYLKKNYKNLSEEQKRKLLKDALMSPSTTVGLSKQYGIADEDTNAAISMTYTPILKSGQRIGARNLTTMLSKLFRVDRLSVPDIADMPTGKALGLTYLLSKFMTVGSHAMIYNQVNSLSGKQLDDEFKRVVLNGTPWNNGAKNMGVGYINSLIEIAHQQDARFERDPQTWMRIVEKNIKANFKADKIRDEADYINQDLKKTVDYYNNLNNKVGKFIDVEKAIYDIERRLKEVTQDKNAALAETIKHEMRLNAALANQKALQNEVKNISEARLGAFNASLSDILSKFGANKQALDQLFSSLANMGDTDRLSGLKRMLFDDPEKLLSENPDKFFKRIRRIADNFAHNRIKLPIDVDQIREAENIYNAFAFRTNSEPISITMEVDELDEAKLKSNLEQIEAAINAVERYSDEVDKQRTELNNKIATNKNLIETYRQTPGLYDNAVIPQLKGDIKIYEEEIARLTEEQYKVDEAMKNLQNAFNKPSIMSEVNKLNKQNQFMQTVSMKASLRDQVESTQLEVDALNAQTQKNQEINDLLEKQTILRKAGLQVNQENLDIYRQELDAVININKQLGSAKLNKNLKDRLEDTRISLLEKMGESKDANRLQFLSQAYNIKGGELNSDEYDMVMRIADLVKRVNDMNIPSQIDDVIHSNELAAKGGFASSVVVEKKDNTDRIINLINKMKEQENDILGIIRDINNNKL